MAQQASPLLLGTEKISTLLLRYAIPAIIAMTAASLYNLMDSIFIGHGVGPLALSGLGITMPLMNLGAAFGSLVGIGASTQLSIKMGQDDRDSALLILGNVIILNTVIGIAYSAIGLPFLDSILYFFGASDNTIGFARSYMFIILAGNVITHVYLGLNDMLRASGYPGRAMAIMLTAVILNGILNAIFIFGFGWGIAGAAWATIIAQAPKMRPYIDQMRENIAGALGICMEQVSVKATTEEGLGFTGEGKGISAQAICLLTSPREMATMEAAAEASARSCEGCPGCNAVKH